MINRLIPYIMWIEIINIIRLSKDHPNAIISWKRAITDYCAALKDEIANSGDFEDKFMTILVIMLLSPVIFIWYTIVFYMVINYFKTYPEELL